MNNMRSGVEDAEMFEAGLSARLRRTEQPYGAVSDGCFTTRWECSVCGQEKGARDQNYATRRNDWQPICRECYEAQCAEARRTAAS